MQERAECATLARNWEALDENISIFTAELRGRGMFRAGCGDYQRAHHRGQRDVVPSGTIIVRGGKIVSAGAGKAETKGLKVIDAKGMSALPGFIDAHKHINTGPDEKAQMQSLLEAGYTTVLSGGGPGDGSIALRDHIESGMINGPRIIPSERINLKGTPDEARAAIRAMAAKGIKHTGEIALTPEPGPTPAEIEVLKAVVDEAAKAGVQVNVHAVSTPATVAAIDAGVRRFVHLPNKDWTSREAAAKVASTNSIVLGLIAFGAPIIDRESPAPAPVVFPKTTRRDSATARRGRKRSPARTGMRMARPWAPRRATPSSTPAPSGMPAAGRRWDIARIRTTRTSWFWSTS